PTAATDGRDIFINPRFWNGLTPAERLGLLAHEVLHAALLHVPRRGKRNPLIWNIAADIVVNGIVLAQEGFVLPKGHLRNMQRELTHLSPSQWDWRSYLWRFLVQTPTDFQGFDRRFIGQGLYLDVLAGEKLRVFVAVDTSGSIGTKEIALFLGEVQAILGSYP